MTCVSRAGRGAPCPQPACFGFSVRDKKWTELDKNQHRTHAMRLLDGLEVTAREKRLKVARAILYVAQGDTRPLRPEVSPLLNPGDGSEAIDLKY